MIAALALVAAKSLLVDGRPVDVGPIEATLDAYVAPLERTAGALSGGRVTFRRDTPIQGSLLGSDGKPILTLPIEPLKPPPGADIAAEATVPGVGSKIPLATVPFEKTIDGETVVVADIQEIAGMLGAGMSTSDAGFEATTADAWDSMLGLPKRVGTAPEDLAQDLGVSPPALTMVLWARARRDSWVQIYALSDGIPEPMLGIDPLTGQPVSGTEGIAVRPRALVKDGSLRVPTQHGKNKIGETGMYAALFLRSDPGDADPLEEIQSGRIKPEDYIVVGVRQKIGASPVIFKTVRTQTKETLRDTAKRVKVDLALLRALNGLVPDEKVPAETSLVVPDTLRVPAPPKTNSLYVGTTYAEAGDTLTDLATRWHVPLRDLQAANPGVEPDAKLSAGELLTRLRPGPVVAQPVADPVLPKKAPIGTATVAKASPLRSSPSSPPSGDPLPEGAIVDVVDKVGASYRVVFRGKVGFMMAASLTNFDLDIVRRPTKKPDNIKRIGVDALPSRPYIEPTLSPLVRTALRYYGTPYLWGGASLTRGIDCSHFVAAVYQQAGLKCPPPPVLSQEVGNPVHWKVPGMAVRMGGTTKRLPNVQASMTRLRPGDRIIIQRNLTDASGTRHTGIYGGRMAFRGRIYNNAMIHASCSRGITVDEMTSSWIWKDYKFSLGSGVGGVQ